MSKYSPMITQYLDIKNKYQDYIVFYRLGDFYEMFFEDALLASKELDLTLTGRDCGAEERAPMCGVPYHSAEAYIARLIEKGYKIAVSEQVSDPKESKGIVKREVVRIITPGTVTESSMLDDGKNNFIASVFKGESQSSVSFSDITTGTIYTTLIRGGDISQKIINEIGKFVPREVILNSAASSDEKVIWFLKDRIVACIESNQDYRFEGKKCIDYFKKVFPNFEPDNIENTIILAVGGILDYLEETQIKNLANITTLDIYSESEFLELDINARRNLELCETMRDKNKKGSLLWVLDKTKTSMGARLIRRFLEKPLTNPTHIIKRLNFVEKLVDNQHILDDISDILKNISDIERLIGKVVYTNATPKDLQGLSASIKYIPKLKSLVGDLDLEYANNLSNQMNELYDIVSIIDSAICDEPSVFIRDGNIIRDGYDENVDELRKLSHGGKEKLLEIEQREREKTGIKNLKVAYNKVFGYYIEVTKSYMDSVPDYYIRKQTLANCERYIIEELKIHEDTVLSAQDKLIKLEQEIYKGILKSLASYVLQVQQTATSIATVDVLCSYAQVSLDNDYVKPNITLSDAIIIKDGRHPVVEKILKEQRFVPNDTHIDTKNERICIITGPNMAGKSTYMRQVALITIMAQIGCFVPAKSAEIAIVDKIFTRVGASDDLATGQSTFMVEMNEVSDILKNATKRSLVILDEIGRGTSTFDGMSIAKAVVEHINKKICCKTLFSTHYHELTSMENENGNVVNYNIAVLKKKDDITFLRKIIRGGADDSFGIEVAKLAGIENSVIKRAKQILEELEQNSGGTTYIEKEIDTQITLSFEESKIIEKLKAVNINSLTPMEAMNLVFELQKMI